MKISVKQYARVVYDLTADLPETDVAAVIGKIAQLISQQKDQRKLPAITDEFSRLYDQRRGIVHATVTTVRPLATNVRSALCDLIAKRTGTVPEKVLLETAIDPEIRGGMVVQIGNEIWDASIKRKLEQLTSHLTH